MKSSRRYLIGALLFLGLMMTVVVLAEVYKSRETTVKPDQLITDTVEHLRQAGKLIMNIKTSGKYEEFSKGKTVEGFNDIVTMADIASNELIKKFFSTNYPRINLITEEDYSRDRDNSKLFKSNHESLLKKPNRIDLASLTAIIDPLDATQEYTEGLYQYTSIMVCFLQNNKPLIGITYFPSIDQVFWVHNKKKDSGNFHKVNEIFNLKPNTSAFNVMVSRSHTGNASEWLNKFQNKREYINMVKAGGAGYKSVMVAGNVADLYLHTTAIKIWDVCNAIVFGEHFKNLQVFDTSFNDVTLKLDDPVLHKGFILANTTSVIKFLLEQNIP